MTAPTNIYVIKCREFYKVGISNSIKKRMNSLNTSVPFELEVIANYKPLLGRIHKYDRSKVLRSIERAIHHYFMPKRVKGEWFVLSDGDLAQIPKIIENSIQYVKSTREVRIKLDMDQK